MPWSPQLLSIKQKSPMVGLWYELMWWLCILLNLLPSCSRSGLAMRGIRVRVGGGRETKVMSILERGHKLSHRASAGSLCWGSSSSGSGSWAIHVPVPLPGKVFPTTHLHPSRWRLGAGDRLKWVLTHLVDPSFPYSHLLHNDLSFPPFAPLTSDPTPDIVTSTTNR